MDAVQRRANGVLQPEVDTSRSPSVGRGVPNYKYPLPKADGVPGWAATNYGRPAYGTDGKLKNDPASGVRTWADREYRNKVGKTGTVDTSSGPRMPTYGPADKPGWKPSDRSTVPEWAIKEYQKDAPKTLIASVADGKIGSIYFPGGRIRTTHRGGPKKSKHGETLQYNIDYDAAEAEFKKKNGKLIGKLLKSYQKHYKNKPGVTKEMIERAAWGEYFNRQHSYIANKLNAADTPSNMPRFVKFGAKRSKLPEWAKKQIKSPADAPGMAEPTTDTFFEVFRGINGRVESWHPSRGAAKKWVTNKQVVSVLKAAIKHIRGIKDANARNIAFYDFIYHRIPSFAAEIRKPDEI